MKKNVSGISIIEFIISVAIFSIIASVITVLVLQGFSINRLGNEETKSSFLAQEGIEATTSIRNQSFSNLANGNYGVSRTAGYWQFLGTSDLIDNKYTRVVTVADGLRDIDNNLVESGGNIDVNTKKIISTVSWNFTPSRQNQTAYTVYLTNWQEGVVVPTPTGSPTPTLTPTPTSTSPTNTPTPTPTNCNQYCLFTYGRTGLCAKSNQCGSPKINAGRIYECLSPNYCCCQ